MDDLPDLSRDHAARLRWFHERTGEIVPWPAEDEAGRLLVTKAKGIYKPEGYEHALSVRIMRQSPYADGELTYWEDGTWSVAYHQERQDPAERDQDFTNRALMQNLSDGVPVAVIKEATAGYEVLGLAQVLDWDDGYFLLAGGPSATRIGWPELAVRLAQDEVTTEVQNAPPLDNYDARKRVLRNVVARRGQPQFRSLLLHEYQGRCAISECAVEAVLEAAHLRPYRGPESNVATNGLLLRSDLHTLLDLGLLRIRPRDRTAWFAEEVRARSPYSGLHGRAIATPRSRTAAPPDDLLTSLWEAGE